MESFQQPAFEFSKITNAFDPSFIPEDGHQYLQKVAFERGRCPAIVVKPLKKSNNKITIENRLEWNMQNIQPDEIEDIANETLLPTKGWNQVQVMHFNQIRDQISKLRLQDKSTANSIEALPTDNTPELWLDYCRAKAPLLSVMFQVPQRTLETLIEYQSNWLNEDNVIVPDHIHWLSPWIYASLACLHLPLEPNMHNILRCIAKTCIRLRNSLLQIDTKTVVPLNLLICIISQNFNQFDLSGRSIEY